MALSTWLAQIVPFFSKASTQTAVRSVAIIPPPDISEPVIDTSPSKKNQQKWWDGLSDDQKAMAGLYIQGYSDAMHYVENFVKVPLYAEYEVPLDIDKRFEESLFGKMASVAKESRENGDLIARLSETSPKAKSIPLGYPGQRLMALFEELEPQALAQATAHRQAELRVKPNTKKFSEFQIALGVNDSGFSAELALGYYAAALLHDETKIDTTGRDAVLYNLQTELAQDPHPAIPKTDDGLRRKAEKILTTIERMPSELVRIHVMCSEDAPHLLHLHDSQKRIANDQRAIVKAGGTSYYVTNFPYLSVDTTPAAPAPASVATEDMKLIL